MSTGTQLRRLLAFFLTLGILLGGLPAAAWAAEPTEPVEYVNTPGGGAGNAPCTDYTLLDSNAIKWTEGWYVVKGNVQIDSRVTVTGNVNLILTDGCTLAAKDGITVQGEGNSLTIWGQSGGTGTLMATTSTEYAAIGGEYGNPSGTITINGGTVNAKAFNGAGIGSGILAESSKGSSTIIINGGTVTASSQKGGAGIGSGSDSGSGSKCDAAITINGGTVTATGGAKDPSYTTGGGAGIGSGERTRDGSTITITITGGTVTATGGGSAAGIGGGGANVYEGSAGGTVTISGNSRVTAKGGALGGAGIGGGLGEDMGGHGTLDIPSDSNVLIDASSIGPEPTVASGASAILFKGDHGTVHGTFVLSAGETLNVADGQTLTVPNGASLTVPDGAKLIVRSGATLNNDGTVTVDPGNFIQEPGATVTGTGTPPAGTPSYAIPTASVDYTRETLKGLAAGGLYRIAVDGASAIEKTADADGTIPLTVPDWLGRTLSITRICPEGAADTISDSEPQTLSIKARPSAPTASDYTVYPPDYKGQSGHIEFNSSYTAYQYRAESKPDWQAVDRKSLALPAGTYSIRYAPTVSDFASEAAKVVIQEATQENPYKIELSGDGLTSEIDPWGEQIYHLDFGQVEYGYSEITARTITVTNKGIVQAMLTLTPAFTADSFNITWGEGFSQDAENSDKYTVNLAPNETATFSIQPKTGLAIDNYFGEFDFNAKFTSGDGSKQINLPLFIVFQVCPAAPVFNPASTGFKGESITVTITCPTEGAEIYYTTDDSEPELSETEQGWQPANENTKKYENSITLTDTTTIKAVSVKNGCISLPGTATYTKINIVTFNSGEGSPVEPVRVEKGTPAQAPAAPTREGFTFSGWFTETACETAWDFTHPVTENITLYAKWTPNVTITFNSNGGSEVEAQTVERGTTAAAPANPTKEGHAFAGWFTDAACTTAWNFDSPVTDNLTLYAKWSQNTVEMPVFSPVPAAGETFEESVTVSIACATDGAEIYYTTDGTLPTASSARYTAPLTLTETTTLTAIAMKPGWRDSGTVSATYTKKDAPAPDGHEHTYTEEITKQPTCTEPGEKTKTCTQCSAEKTEIIAALGHAFDEGKVTKEPTADAEGEKTFTCTRCSATKTERIPKLPAPTPEYPTPTPVPPTTTPSQPSSPAPEQPGQDNWQEQPPATPEAGADTTWKYVDETGVTATTPQVLPTSDGTPRLYLFDGSGSLQTGAVSSSTAANGTEIRISPEGDVEMNGCLYYLNPNRVLTNPRSCYAVRDYMRALPEGAGSRFYDKNGITFAGWLRDSDGKMRYQTVIQTETRGRYLLVVWRVQTLPACQDPDHPGDPAYMIPAGRYFFDDFGVLVTEEGWHDGKDGREYYTNDRGQVLHERPRA